MLLAESHLPALCAAVYEQPACFAAFEAALRSLGMCSVLAADAHAGAKCASSVIAALHPPDAAAFESIAANHADKLQLQLFSLCVSCLKHAALSMEAEPAPKLVHEAALSTLLMVGKVGGCVLLATPISSSSAGGRTRSSSNSSKEAAAAAAAAAAAELWVVLLTRCLLLSSAILECITLWDGEEDNVTVAANAVHQAAAVASDCLTCIADYIELAVPAAASPQVRDTRLWMGSWLHRLVTSWSVACTHGGFVCNCCAADADATETAVQLLADVATAVQEEGLAEQLQNHAALVASLLPLPHVCNNPGCVSLEQHSEQVLVSGKGSRCSGCKVAR
jgi:hypothetical protein